ncbi:hypothetical protein EVG20_g9442, partial [Dentipellis fragilis]
YELVVADCDAALKLDAHYIKALNRRATALEALERLHRRDDPRQVPKRRGRNGGRARAQKALHDQGGRDPRDARAPAAVLHIHFCVLCRVPAPCAAGAAGGASTGDNTLILALQALQAADYAHSVSLVNEAIEQGISWDAGKAEAFNLRGTFKFLTGDIVGAKDDLQKSIDLLPSLTQSWVKIASVWMEQGDPAKTFECFEEAIKHNPNDPDIYYHRGQVLFIMNDFAGAAENYTKSTDLDDQFVFSHIQLAVAQYKSGNLANSMATFRRTLKAFPQRSEPQNYYGELLLDQQRFQDAVEKFDRAIELEREKTTMNVLPLVNKGLAMYQWKQDIAAAERCCHEALRIDPECEARRDARAAQPAAGQGRPGGGDVRAPH